MEHGWDRGQSLVRVSIYIEGGGIGERLDRNFRTAWGDFFTSAGLAGRLPTVVRCGDRARAFRRFSAAVRTSSADELPILLVDSEGPVVSGHTSWQHLRAHDGWQPPAGVSGDRAFLMVQAMEAWLLADRDALRNYFGASFRENRLPQQANLENVPQNRLEPSLRDASAACSKQYAKGTISFEILAQINANTVAEKCEHAKSLLEHLRSL